MTEYVAKPDPCAKRLFFEPRFWKFNFAMVLHLKFTQFFVQGVLSLTNKGLSKSLDFNLKFHFIAHKILGLCFFILTHNNYLSRWIVQEQHQYTQNHQHSKHKWMKCQPCGMYKSSNLVQIRFEWSTSIQTHMLMNLRENTQEPEH